MIIIIVTAVETSNLTFNENIRFVANWVIFMNYDWVVFETRTFRQKKLDF
jgi:hypothetical protein